MEALTALADWMVTYGPPTVVLGTAVGSVVAFFLHRRDQRRERMQMAADAFFLKVVVAASKIKASCESAELKYADMRRVMLGLQQTPVDARYTCQLRESLEELTMAITAGPYRKPSRRAGDAIKQLIQDRIAIELHDKGLKLPPAAILDLSNAPDVDGLINDSWKMVKKLS